MFFPNVGVKKYVLNFLAFLFTVFVGKISWLNSLIDPLIIRVSDSRNLQAAEAFHAYELCGSILFGVALAFSLLILRKNAPRKHKLFYYLSWLGLIFCLVSIPIAGGGLPALRFLHALPIVTAFLVIYLIKYADKAKTLVFLVVLFFGIVQVRNSSFLIISDHQRYEQDVTFAVDLGRRIQAVQSSYQHFSSNSMPVISSASNGTSSSDMPVIVFGTHEFKYSSNYIFGNVIGKSAVMFGSDVSTPKATGRTVAFMNLQGFEYKAFDIKQEEQLIEHLREYVLTMPSYPDKDCVSVCEGVIVVKLDYMQENDQ